VCDEITDIQVYLALIAGRLPPNDFRKPRNLSYTEFIDNRISIAFLAALI
jgi:hypothetical protein